MRHLLLLCVLGAACNPPPAAPRFADRAILWRDPDEAAIPMPPVRPDPGTGRDWPGARDAIFLPAEHAFTVDYGLEAVNVNAFDEVPGSSWYDDPKRDPQNPGGPPRVLAAEVLERGVVTDSPPQPPFRIVRAKESGSAIGLVVDDALGRRYLLKFDPDGHRGLVSASDVVATRLAWGAGWRVPANEILTVAKSELVLLPTATMLDVFGKTHRLDPGDVEQLLYKTDKGADGRMSAVASRWVDGVVLGNFPYYGRIKADPNDRYLHQDRRDLRGFGIWSSWVDNVDTMENNTLDSYIGESGRGHVVHYQQDVGASFGNFANTVQPYWMGDESYFGAGHIGGSLLTFGIMPYSWENAKWQWLRRQLVDQYPEFGGFSAHNFNPRTWTPILDNPAFVRATRRDHYWGAKRVVAFQPDEIKGAIAAGHYRPAAAQYLYDALWQRRARIARAYFNETAPLDYFSVEPGKLCFDDLWLTTGLGGVAGTTYRVGEEGVLLDVKTGSDPTAEGKHICVTLPGRPGYRIIKLAAMRPGERHFEHEVAVHLVSRGPNVRIVGIIR